MSLLMMLIVLMAIVYGIEFAMHPDEKTGKSSTESIKSNFFKNIGLFYQFMIGENPYESSMSTTAWIVYIIFTVVVQIVALNLLIAVLSETFANVTAKMDANHCKTKIEVLIEISGLKCCFQTNNEK